MEQWKIERLNNFSKSAKMRWSRREKITMIIIKGKNIENSGQMKNIFRFFFERRKIPKVYWTFIIKLPHLNDERENILNKSYTFISLLFFHFFTDVKTLNIHEKYFAWKNYGSNESEERKSIKIWQKWALISTYL